MMWWDGNNWGWGMGLMMFFGVTFWGGIIALIVWAVTRLTRRETHSGGKPSPLDIAREPALCPGRNNQRAVRATQERPVLNYSAR